MRVTISNRRASFLATGLCAALTCVALTGCDNAASKKEAAEAVAAAASETAAPPAEIAISPPFQKESGYAWIVTTSVDPTTRKLRAFEDGKPLGPGDSLHDDIRENGKGAYSHWSAGPHDSVVYFSTSDNSDPNTNGRTYTLK